MSSAYASSTTTFTTTSTSPSRPLKPPKPPKPPKSPIVSSGRGGSGNKRPKSVLKLDLGDEAEILRKRRLEASLNPRVKVKYTGRGGSGNIRAASQAQSIPFDISADPDDDYERIVLQGAQNAKKDKLPSTGRGGLGNLHRPRSKSFVAASITSKGKKDKSRRRRSASSSSQFTTSTTSAEHFELQRLTADTSRLSLNISASRLTPASSPSSPLHPPPEFRSSLPTPPSPSPAALYIVSAGSSTTTSLPAPSIRTPRSSSSSSGLFVLPVVASAGIRSTPSLPLRSPNSHTTPGPTPGSALNLPAQAHPASQSTASLSSLPGRVSTSSLGLLSPPASPVAPEASIPAGAGSGQKPSTTSIADPTKNDTPHKLQKSKSHDTTPSKWWKMGGRRRLKEVVAVSPQDAAYEGERIVVCSPDVAPAAAERPVPVTSEQQAMAHLQEVGMHAMEVRMRLREERLSIIRNSQRALPQEFDDNSESVVGDDGDGQEGEPYALPSVPEEEDGGCASFLDFY